MVYTQAEQELIRQVYEDNIGKSGWLPDLALRLGKDKSSVCRCARRLGLTDRNRSKEFPNRQRIQIIASCDICKKKFNISAHYKRKTCSSKCRGELLSKTMLARTTKEVAVIKEKAYQTAVVNNSYAGRGGYSRARGGKRKDLGDKYFRSRWEANMARYFRFMKMDWVFEPQLFMFEQIKRGTRSYTPDFLVDDMWVEIKGYMDSKSVTKIKRFKKYYPDEFEKFYVVVEKFGCDAYSKAIDIGVSKDHFMFYNEIVEKLAAMIKGWEY